MNYGKTLKPPAHRTRPAVVESDIIPCLIPSLVDEDASSTDQTALVPQSVRSTKHATLMVIGGGAAGQVFRLTAERTTIGRGKGIDVCISDEGVSRAHCVVVREREGVYSVSDNDSTNGTLVNGMRIDKAQLHAGDRIQLGPEAVFQFGHFDDAEEELAKRLYEGATRDVLTRAFNRRYLLERLEAEVSFAVRRNDKLVAVFLDLDRFKSINDTYGHSVGDGVLRDVAAGVNGMLRNEDVFARYGGEEFVVIARDLTLEQGAKLAERIRVWMEQRHFLIEGRRFRATISAGVAELAECGEKRVGIELVKLADTRLYKAKQTGRNRVVLA